MTDTNTNDFHLPDEVKIPEEFYKIINDFVNDIQLTFPEYTGIIKRWWTEEENQANTLAVFKHCVKIFPEKFFDILYKNNTLFDDGNTEFLPGIVFKQLWNCDISDKTRDTIWKYLQLILFSVIGSVRDTSELGDTAKLFESINEEELKTKLKETLEDMQHLFENENGNGNADTFTQEEKDKLPIPNADDIHNHIHGMMEGKLGKLAMELAEETAQELNLDMDNVTTSQEVLQKLLSNPGKMMNMVKNVGGKIDEKIKSGEIKESELISEGVEILNKMQNMPGMGNMQEMFSKLGIPGLGKGAKINTAAMEAQLKKNLKLAKMKEQMKTKMEQKKQSQAQQSMNADTSEKFTDEQIISIFSTGEKVEKTPRVLKKKNKNKK